MKALNRLICKLFNHKLRRINKTKTTDAVLCIRCMGRFMIHHPTRSFLPMDGELEAAFVEEKRMECEK